MKVTFIKTGKRVKPKKEKEKNNNKSTINKTTYHKSSNKKMETNKSEAFRTIFRKNQVVLLTLALMLVTAGYMNYNNSNNELNISLADVGDAKLVSTNVIDENIAKSQNEVEEKNEVNSNETEENEVSNSEIEEHEVSSNAIEENEVGSNEIENEKVNSGNVVSNEDYYTKTRLERQTMYSQMLEAYQKILENEKIPADQKSIAANEIKNINDRINAISIIENLIKTKGFEDVIILINDNNINVVVKQDSNLSQEQVAQITNIVSRELKSEIEDIHITVQK